MRTIGLVLGLSLVLVGCRGSDLPPVGATEPPASSSNSSVPLRFEDPALAGLCESMISDFAAGEPGLPTKGAARDEFVSDNPILEGLTVSNGAIKLGNDEVGSYDLIERPESTFGVERAQWCYPEATSSP